jgi:Uma2 family endonuclease
MASIPTIYISPDEYLAIERKAERKSEYVSGQMFAMAGASFVHARIVGNLSFVLQTALRGGPCVTVTNDVRVSVPETKMYTYPDILVVCGEPEFVDSYLDTLRNPTILVEVLSRSTENWDRGGKFEHYRQLESLQEYLLVSQEKALVEQRTRQSGDTWLLREHTGLDASLSLPSIGCEILLRDIYQGISLPADRPELSVTPADR